MGLNYLNMFHSASFPLQTSYLDYRDYLEILKICNLTESREGFSCLLAGGTAYVVAIHATAGVNDWKREKTMCMCIYSNDTDSS